MAELDADEIAAVEAAYDIAQTRIAGPIVCVLARASSNYELASVAASAFAALIAPWPLLIWTQLSAQRVYLIQLAIFLIALVLLSLTGLGLSLTPMAVRRANAHRAALGQFMVRGVARSASRSGVLIYVSLLERYARIVADDGAAAVISAAQWQGVVDALVAEIKAGQTAKGLVAASGQCADLLAPHFPAISNAPPHPSQHFHVT